MKQGSRVRRTEKRRKKKLIEEQQDNYNEFIFAFLFVRKVIVPVQ